MALRRLAAALALAGAIAQPALAATFFISPQGDDTNDGASAAKPFKSFAKAFPRMAAGDELVLLDGDYSEAAGTGTISYRGPGPGSGGPLAEQVPSGKEGKPTVVRAQNPGKVKVHGHLFLGRSKRKDSHIVVDGITFIGGGSFYNTSHVTVRNCGFHGYFGMGTNDHNHGNEHNLVEDSWVWASGERIIAINYRANKNVWRRVVVRGDGCGLPKCRGGGNPNVGFTVYDSSDVSVQNVMVVDRVLAPGDSPYGDFAAAQHTPGAHFFGRNEWLGTISLKAPDVGYYLEPDLNGTVNPTIRISNAIAWDAAGVGFNLTRAGADNVVENVTAQANHFDAIRIAPELTTGVLRNALVAGAGRYGISSRYEPRHVAVHGSRGAPGHQSACRVGCYLHDARSGSTPSLRYLPRIEEGSFLKGKGEGGADIGANVMYRYGEPGTRFGDPGYNKLTTAPLWPWPNEARIKQEMCVDAKVSRGFCGAPSLTRYVWEYLGTPMPADPYAKGPPRR